MKKVTVTNNSGLERAYAGIDLKDGESKDATLSDADVAFLDASPFDVEVLEEVEEEAAAPELRDLKIDRHSDLADAEAFALAQSAHGDVNEIDPGDDGLISKEDVAQEYGLSLDSGEGEEVAGEETPDSARQGRKGPDAPASTPEQKPEYLGKGKTTDKPDKTEE